MCERQIGIPMNTCIRLNGVTHCRWPEWLRRPLPGFRLTVNRMAAAPPRPSIRSVVMAKRQRTTVLVRTVQTLRPICDIRCSQKIRRSMPNVGELETGLMSMTHYLHMRTSWILKKEKRQPNASGSPATLLRSRFHSSPPLSRQPSSRRCTVGAESSINLH